MRKEKEATSLVYFKSTICEINLQDTCARGDKYSSKLDIFSLAYSYLCAIAKILI